MYERNEVSNRAQGAIAGSTLLTAGLPGQGYIDNATKPAPTLPVHQAIEELEKELNFLRDNVITLMNRISPVCKGRKEYESIALPPSYCELEGRINNSKANVTELSAMVSSAREALCI